MRNLKQVSVGFYGTPEFSLNFLKDLYSNKVKISYIVTQPPRYSGRGKKINLSPVHKWGVEKNIKVLTPLNTKDKDFLNYISKHKIDLNIVVAYGNLLTQEIINLPKFMSINVHASLLPKWRGAAPIQRAILSDDRETGVCIMKVEEKLDSGPIIMLKKFVIAETDNYGTIYNKIVSVGKKLLKQSVFKVINDQVDYEFQKERFVTYAKKIAKSESKIVWSNGAHEINLKIRAFSPMPGAWTSLKNSSKRIKILKANVINEEFNLECDNLEIGEVTENLEVKCGVGFLKIEILQKEGKKPLLARDFLNGNKIKNYKFC